jgi:hypothetical protein
MLAAVSAPRRLQCLASLTPLEAASAASAFCIFQPAPAPAAEAVERFESVTGDPHRAPASIERNAHKSAHR